MNFCMYKKSTIHLQLVATIMADTVLSKALKKRKHCFRLYLPTEGQQEVDIVRFVLGLNGISRVVEGIAHDICEGVVQFSEHLWRILINVSSIWCSNSQPVYFRS